MCSITLLIQSLNHTISAQTVCRQRDCNNSPELISLSCSLTYARYSLCISVVDLSVDKMILVAEAGDQR